MNVFPKRRGAPAAILPALAGFVVLAAALAACGPGGTQAKAPNDQQKALTAYTDCLRQHGVPVAGNGTITIQGGNGPSQSQIQAAQQACQSLRPKGVQTSGGANQQYDRLLQWAGCMRQHGVNVPDPTRSQTGGVLLQVPPGQDQQTVQAAEQACRSLRPSPPSSSNG
jgi:hypothetical protein